MKLQHSNEAVEPTYITIVATEPGYQRLFELAGKIGGLLKSALIKSDPNLAAPLDDLLGSVYSLILAKQHGFANRMNRPVDLAPVAQRAGQMAKGRIRVNGKWIAGFYFNNALFRTAAVYHRALKTIVGKRNGYVPELLPKLKKEFPNWIGTNIAKVHDQVNELKHAPRGVHDKRTVTSDIAVAAIDELVALIERYVKKHEPSRKADPGRK